MPSPLLYDRIERAKERTRREHLRNQLESSLKHDPEQNNVDVFVLSTEEVVELWIAKQRSRGKSDEEINDDYRELVSHETVELIKAQSSTVAGAAKDTKNVAAIMRDFKRSGNISGKYSTSVRGGRKYIIFKGNHKLREIIKGTRYLANNRVLMKLGIGARAATSLIKGSMLVTVIVSPFVHTYSWIFDPKFGWKDFLKNVSSDLVIAFLSAVAGALFYGAVSAATAASVVALGVGVFVAVIVGGALSFANMDLSLTDAVIDSTVDAYEYASSEAGTYYRAAKKSARDFYYYLFDNDSGTCTVQKVEPKVAEELRGRMHRVTNYPKVPHQAL